MPEKVLRKVLVQNGVPRKVPKKVLRVPSPMLPLYRRGARAFFGTFLGTPFWTSTFLSAFSGTFPGRGFGTSLDGCQDCNLRLSSDRDCSNCHGIIHCRKTMTARDMTGFDAHVSARKWGHILHISFLERGKIQLCTRET